MPDFDTEYVHWRKRFDVPKQLDEKDVKIEDLFAEKNVSKDEYVKKFLEVETREYIPKNNDIKPEFKEGERVYAKRGKFCHLAEIRAHYARRFYVVEFLENGAEETIYPEDITTFDYRKRIPNIDENFQIWHFETQTRLSVKLKRIMTQEIYYVEYDDGEEATCDQSALWRHLEDMPENFRNALILRSDQKRAISQKASCPSPKKKPNLKVENS